MPKCCHLHPSHQIFNGFSKKHRKGKDRWLVGHSVRAPWKAHGLWLPEVSAFRRNSFQIPVSGLGFSIKIAMYIFGSQPPSHKHKKFILSFRVFKRILLLIGKLAIHLGGKEIPTLLIIYTKLLLDEKNQMKNQNSSLL